MNTEKEFLLIPDQRNWYAIAIWIVIAVIFILCSSPLLFLPNYFFGIGLLWYSFMAWIFIKVGQQVIGSEIIKIRDTEITYRWAPFGLHKRLRKSNIAAIRLTNTFLTELESQGANSLGVTKCKLSVVCNKREYIFGRYLQKEQGETILRVLAEYGYPIRN